MSDTLGLHGLQHARLQRKAKGRNLATFLSACMLSFFISNILVCVCAKSLQSSLTLCSQVPLSVGFPRQEYWNELPSPLPGNLPDPGIKPTSLMSPALAGSFFTTNGNPLQCSCLENPGTGESGGLLSLGSHRVGHD